jgi:hypothetical protein
VEVGQSSTPSLEGRRCSPYTAAILDIFSSHRHFDLIMAWDQQIGIWNAKVSIHSVVMKEVWSGSDKGLV